MKLHLTSGLVLMLELILISTLGSVVTAQDGRGCPIACTREYNPICAELERPEGNLRCTFSNPCMLKGAVRCGRLGKNWRVVGAGACARRQNRMCQSIMM